MQILFSDFHVNVDVFLSITLNQFSGISESCLRVIAQQQVDYDLSL